MCCMLIKKIKLKKKKGEKVDYYKKKRDLEDNIKKKQLMDLVCILIWTNQLQKAFLIQPRQI